MFFVLAREIKLRIFVQFLELNQLLLFVMNKIHSLNRVMGFARNVLFFVIPVPVFTKSDAYTTI